MQSQSSDEVTTIDLFQKQLPAFDGFALPEKYSILGGQSTSGEEKNAWCAIEPAHMGGPEGAQEKRAEALKMAKEMAKSF